MKPVRLRMPVVYGSVLLAALLLRGAALSEWAASPFSHFSEIPGLDMRTHLELGALFARGQGVWAFYRLVTALFQSPAVLVTLQCLAGCLTALLTAFIARRLFRHRGMALVSGLCAALYGNAVLYELATLPETFHVLISAGAFAALLQARRRQFSPFWSALAGALLALTATGRPTGVIAVLAALAWTGGLLYRRKQFKRARFIVNGLLLVWLPVMIWNWNHGWKLPVYGSNFAYAAGVAEKTEITSWNVEVPRRFSTVRTVKGAIAKIPKVISIREIPDNLNYSFLRERFLFMRFTLPVAGLVILALSGILLLICRRNRRGLLLLGWCAALAVIFTAYYPAGRYRLILYPYAAVFAGGWLFAVMKSGRIAALLIGMLVTSAEWIAVPEPAVRRAADHTAWGLGAMRMPGMEKVTRAEFAEAVRLSSGGVRETARLLDWLLRHNDLPQVRKVLLEYPGNDPYRRYYRALIELADGNALGARRALEALSPESVPELRGPYAYFLGEACRLSGDNAAALRAYRELLKMPLRPEMRKTVEEKLNGLK